MFAIGYAKSPTFNKESLTSDSLFTFLETASRACNIICVMFVFKKKTGQYDVPPTSSPASTFRWALCSSVSKPTLHGFGPVVQGISMKLNYTTRPRQSLRPDGKQRLSSEWPIAGGNPVRIAASTVRCRRWRLERTPHFKRLRARFESAAPLESIHLLLLLTL